MRNHRRFAAIAAVVAVVGLSQAGASAAVAADQPAEISFSTTSSTIEYGQFWSFQIECDFAYYMTVDQPGNTVVTSTGTPSGYTPELYVSSPYAGPGYLSTPYEVPALGAGTYTFTVGGSGTDGTDNFSGQTTPPATLKVEKAKLGVDLRVLADPSNGSGALVTAKFTGRFVDEYQSSFFPGAALSPAGIWTISIMDSNDELATERSVERAAGDDVLATSFYWADAEPGQQYTASAAFTPSGASAANFTVSPAADFPYTAPDSVRPVPTSTATYEPSTQLPEATGFGLPLWLIIVVGVLIAGLGVLVTILSVRLNRRSSAITGEGTV